MLVRGRNEAPLQGCGNFSPIVLKTLMKSPNRTIPARGGFGELRMVLEAETLGNVPTRRLHLEGVWTRGGVLARRLSPEGGWTRSSGLGRRLNPERVDTKQCASKKAELRKEVDTRQCASKDAGS